MQFNTGRLIAGDASAQGANVQGRGNAVGERLVGHPAIKAVGFTAMVHGGPYPATSDGRSTSVGTRAIERFLRLVCYQDFPPDALPAPLQDGNPLRLRRLVDGEWRND